MVMGDEVPVVVCDSCDSEFWGVGAMVAQRDGWRRHNYNGGIWTMCPDCEERYKPIWERREAEAAERRRRAKAA